MTGWILAFVLAQGLDAGSSCYGFAHQGVEQNPFLTSSCPRVVTEKVVATGLVLSAAGLLQHWQQPKTARVLLGVGVGVGSVAFLVNVRTR